MLSIPTTTFGNNVSKIGTKIEAEKVE